MKTDIRITRCRLFFIPVVNRVPLRFGNETVRAVTCARVQVEVENREGKRAYGWGETPLNTGWVWPGDRSHEERDAHMREFCRRLAGGIASFSEQGHALELGHLFLTHEVPRLWDAFNRDCEPHAAMPWLAALVCFSPFDIALHDAFAVAAGAFVYDTYRTEYMNHDLSWYYDSDEADRFTGKYPADFLMPMAASLPAWHLVGGEDPLIREDVRGDEPDDGYPVLLEDWIKRDGLRCLKVKLAGRDSAVDQDRLVRVGELGLANGVQWLCADFNCTVDDPSYVTEILDRLASAHPDLYAMILYLEQPFHRDLQKRMLRVESVSARKPLFMDESADDWRQVRLGRELGWSGVALKTCKTQTGALLSLCWAKEHALPVMVQDLTNPMLAQIPHVLLAAHAGTIHGVETNAMQFYPDASLPEMKIHPEIYQRQNGAISLGSISGVGFGYGLERIDRILPQPESYS